MKHDTSGISLADLAAHLEQSYRFPISALSFTPKGEEAYSYIATDPRGERFFVRLQPNGQTTDLEDIYATVAALQESGDVTTLLAPQRTAAGCFTSRLEPYTVALFPFISGTTAYETTISEAHWLPMAEIIAALHTCRVPMASRETFANPFAAPIRKALQSAASPGPQSSIYQQRLLSLLQEQQDDVRTTLRRVHGLGAAARTFPLQFVPTHGDPNLANFLIAEDGSLYLTDWGELALGPRERDLTAFTGDHFAPFLHLYLAVALAGHVQLHRTLFAFYLYRWVAQEIADYTSRILDGPGDPEEEAHAWEELQPYLPVQHAEIEKGLNAITCVLTELGHEGLVEIVR